jgi:hypothetical protein
VLNSEAKVLHGLVALSIEDCKFDWRDSLMVLCRLYHSAVKVGANPTELFQRVAAMSAPRTGELFLSFLSRKPELKDIAVFGWKEGTGADGKFRYVSKLANPFKIGDRVVFAPDERTIGWCWSSFDRLRIHPGDEGVVTKILQDNCIYIDDDRGGFHWQCFKPVPPPR